jgi:hypothetical protein
VPISDDQKQAVMDAMLRSVSKRPGSPFEESLPSAAYFSTTQASTYVTIMGSVPPSNDKTPGTHTMQGDLSLLCTSGSAKEEWRYTVSPDGQKIIWQVGDYFRISYQGCTQGSYSNQAVMDGVLNLEFVGDPAASPPQAAGESASFYAVDYTGLRMESLSNGARTGQYVVYDGHVFGQLATLSVGTSNNVLAGSSIRITEPGRMDSYTQWSGTYLGGQVVQSYNLTGNDVTGLSVVTGTPLTGSGSSSGTRMPKAGTQIGTLMDSAQITLEYTDTGPVFH